MCCFSRPVASVSGTSIFARGDGERQWLAYEMTVGLGEDTAMVLPLPVRLGSGDDAAHFVDLSSYPGFFKAMDLLFPEPVPQGFSALGAPQSRAAGPALTVHEVGDFEASYVPSPAAFERLDPRFRLSDAAWSAMSDYSDWGFAVFKLRAPARPRAPSWWPFGRKPALAERARTISPMALYFPRRDTTRLYFPTLHVHDGTVHDTAHFSHKLYAQGAHETPRSAAWTPATSPLASALDFTRTAGLVSATQQLYRRRLHGELPNADVWL